MTAARPRGWLLDTNVVSELRKGARCHPGVRAWAEAVPLGWQHINLTGDFLWGADASIEPDGFRPLRGTVPKPLAIAA